MTIYALLEDSCRMLRLLRYEFNAILTVPRSDAAGSTLVTVYVSVSVHHDAERGVCTCPGMVGD